MSMPEVLLFVSKAVVYSVYLFRLMFFDKLYSLQREREMMPYGRPRYLCHSTQGQPRICDFEYLKDNYRSSEQWKIYFASQYTQ